MLIARFLLPLLLSLAVLTAIATPLAENLLANWFRRDVSARAEVIFRAVEARLDEHLQGGARAAELKKLFNKIARDDHVAAAGICTDGKPGPRSDLWPPSLPCPPSGVARYRSKAEDGRPLLFSIFPVGAGQIKSGFILVHDLSFFRHRAMMTWLYVIVFMVLVSLTVVLVTVLTIRLTMRDWLRRLRGLFNDPDLRVIGKNLPRELLPVIRDVRQLMRETRLVAGPESLRINWAPQSLKKLLENELPGQEIIVVSNREPYIHHREEDGRVVLQRPASGLVTALEPITRACGGVWIAHGHGNADADAVDEHDNVSVPPENPEYTLHRVWLTPEEEEGYYYGLANDGLWPLCHIAFVRPNFRESDWEAYKTVNRKFANAVVKMARTANPLVLVQDYHFALLPRYVRDKLPDATIITFWHIPWPNAEVFSICPWREEILKGLLGSSVVGFHTRFHCNNFLDSTDRFLESNISRDQSSIKLGGDETLVRSYPISIAWPPEGTVGLPDAGTCREAVIRRHNLPKDALIGVGVERFDYTKGIVDRLQAVRDVLRQRPDLRGRLVFIQAAAPTRSRLPAYQQIQDECAALVEDVNREFGRGDYKPILLLVRHHMPSEVFEMFRAADFCIVSSLHDGMNLVAKEFVAAREDEKGVLILSTFAGASKELMDALLVNPYDIAGTAEAMQRALAMPEPEQQERMRLMREMVRDNNIYYWAARILLDAGLLRKRGRIERLLTEQRLEAAEDADEALQP